MLCPQEREQNKGLRKSLSIQQRSEEAGRLEPREVMEEEENGVIKVSTPQGRRREAAWAAAPVATTGSARHAGTGGGWMGGRQGQRGPAWSRGVDTGPLLGLSWIEEKELPSHMRRPVQSSPGPRGLGEGQEGGPGHQDPRSGWRLARPIPLHRPHS